MATLISDHSAMNQSTAPTTSEKNEHKTDSTNPEIQHGTVQAQNDQQGSDSAREEQSDTSTTNQYQPKTLKFWLILFCVFFSLFLVALDRTIFSTAIPRITDEFHSLGDIGWYGSAYLLASASSQMLYGRIYQYYDMKAVFLSTIVLFEIGSAICGAAPTSNAFIAGRVIAGFASAGIFSGCTLVLISMVPLEKRPTYQAFFGAIFGISSVMGPLVGGAFTSGVTWRWCFYINLPIGALCLLAMVLLWHPEIIKREPVTIATHFKRLDPLGLVFFIPSFVCLLLALQWGGSTYAWNSTRIIALFVVFAVLLLVFAAIQVWRPETATMPGRIVGKRSIMSAAVFVFCLMSSMLLLILFVPIWFQTVKLVNPIKSGVYTLPLVLSLAAMSFLGSRIIQKCGYYVPNMYLGMSILAIGLGLMTTFNLNTSISQWIGYQLLGGFGIGLSIQVASLVVQNTVPGPDIPIGISLMFFLQQIGGAVFTAAGQTILTNVLSSRLKGIEGLDAGLVVNQGATDLVKIVPAKDIKLVQEAYNYACTRIFFTALGPVFLALLSTMAMEWKSIKKNKKNKKGRMPTDSSEAGGITQSSPEEIEMRSSL